ncbi:MAG: hypothetical protein D4R64_04815 [Porphyromonadaceae bacterium]|nr:MAG: hypothetical protein D4R64_04815 [Porphyromonadaceae bacterium]
MNQVNYPVSTLIDPQARVINLASSTRALKLIHRSLLSHLVSLKKNKGCRISLAIEGESFDTEYNSTAQLADDIGNYLKGREDA